ncbi:MAG TPA: bifunctional phosphoribosyl-AMP cyclohydrolase/phosphoribosyl-ATP diphosphatase HisIE [Tahibacter sp.]|uniref:bifunctional phosphoribosyl-AMP cyclohydrolase/phosphoribosyl-ATP diphosphatase HisIE n=1 Tax=Tahibacter sp. TaxID=2056211 RepID=UPI002BB9754C|nr:bifunctional phosphoribosyl-AMP cyclohydrolase/phosphoribosyl-ATP diphosphatase HisIE [Tahibacter sp.]HSX59120.1 bifunctional phosphoribosyl-AMP cyclohydrolase/phosphoribosyl-ATP diphosphatase HisIE [Tahibacter sp.]
MSLDPAALDWSKGGGLLPAVVQHARSGAVLMQGWMNEAALRATLESGKVTFYSRSRQRLWTKGETSRHFLLLREAMTDCDADSLLLRAEPQGPTCHLGRDSCFGDEAVRVPGFLGELDALVAQRERERPAGSYTTKLFDSGVRRIAQKVGEEGVETALAAVAQDDAALIGEAADLLFHLTVLLRARGLSLHDAVAELERRHR